MRKLVWIPHSFGSTIDLEKIFFNKYIDMFFQAMQDIGLQSQRKEAKCFIQVQNKVEHIKEGKIKQKSEKKA